MKKRSRTPAHKVNRRQKALAIRALTAIVSSPDAAEYVKAKAAAALLNNGRDAPDPDAPLRDPDAPQVVVTLPWNGRDHVKFGDQGNGIIIENTANHPLDMPDRIRAHARRRRAEMLALPVPDEDEAE
jgi:hypothetical protein